MSVELGSRRQVFFWKKGALEDNHAFIVRDDAYSQGVVEYGRTIRLGDPVRLGPDSGWLQSTWEGGEDQDIWSDDEMYQEASADVNTKSGKMRMWPGWRILYYEAARPYNRFCLQRGQLGLGFNTPLYFGESDIYFQYDATPPSGGFRLHSYDPATGNIGTAADNYFNIRDIIPLLVPNTVNIALLIADAADNYPTDVGGGSLWWYFEDVGTRTEITYDNTPSNAYWPKGLITNGKDIYALNGNQIAKLTDNVWTNLQNVLTARGMAGIATWNNRIWFGVQQGGGRASIHVTDGTTTTKAFDIPDEFIISQLHVHYGSLFISGFRIKADGSGLGSVGSIYRYTGTTLTKLYEEGIDASGERHAIHAMCSLGPNLVWNRNAMPSTGMRAGVKMWNAETDAIFDGPTMGIDATSTEGVEVTDLISYDNSIAASFVDHHNYGGSHTLPKMVALVRPFDTVRHDFNSGTGGNLPTFVGLSGESFDTEFAGTRTQFVRSSVYHGTDDVKHELKTWLHARLLVKLPAANCSVEVKVILDESGTEISLGTVDYDAGDLGWRPAVFAIQDVDTLNYQSRSIQYVVYLHNDDTANDDSVANPQVDEVHIAWKPVPTFRRTHNLRIICQDSMTDLDGGALTLDTIEEMVEYFETAYADGQPIYFRPARGTTLNEGDDFREVTIQSLQIPSYRVDSASADTQYEIGMTLVETDGEVLEAGF
jgi:hypothetical protein